MKIVSHRLDLAAFLGNYLPEEFKNLVADTIRDNISINGSSVVFSIKIGPANAVITTDIEAIDGKVIADIQSIKIAGGNVTPIFRKKAAESIIEKLSDYKKYIVVEKNSEGNLSFEIPDLYIKTIGVLNDSVLIII